MTPPVLVINRSQDAARLDSFRASAATHGIDPVRIPAHDGHRADFPFALFADLIGDTFWDQSTAKPGALACYLSHMRAWRYIFDQDLPHALICEDDAAFLRDPSALPLRHDLLFANARMAAFCPADSPTTVPLDDLSLDEGESAPAPGADCYLLGQAGARRLLALTAEHKITLGVDWAMIRFARLGGLSAHVLAEPVADQARGAGSTIIHRHQAPLAGLLAREGSLAHTEYVATLRISGAQLCFAGRSGPDPVMEAHRLGQLWDEPGLRLLLDHFPEGGHFVDFGAHLGNHAVAMGCLGGAGRLTLVEPNDEITRLLQANLVMNGIADRVTLVPAGTGAWSDEGSGWILRNRRRSSETMIKTERPEDAGENVSPVRLVPGDVLLDGRPVDAIKIDTSGSEPEVLRGLTGTLRDQRPVVLVDHSAAGLDRIKRLAEDRGYGVSATVPSSRQNRVSSLLLPRPGDAQ